MQWVWFEQSKRKIFYFKPQKNTEKSVLFHNLGLGVFAVLFSPSAVRRWFSISTQPVFHASHKHASPDTWEWARARSIFVGRKGTPLPAQPGCQIPRSPVQEHSSAYWSAQYSCPPTFLLMANKQLEHPQAAFFLAPAWNQLNNQKGSKRYHQLKKLLHSQDASLENATESN